jgi:crossover junction endodeoxyribonuclease RuvC
MRVGIDSGVTGAIALISGSKVIECWDMPVLTVETSDGGQRNEVDARRLYELLRKAHCWKGCTVYVERQQPNMASGVSAVSGKQGRKDSPFTAFTIGKNYGKVLNCVELLFPDEAFKIVHPVSWKGRAGLKGKPKDQSIPRALEVLDTGNYLTRKKDHGRAEAMLIAFYGE